ncbi:hypothetical protein [Natranaeroarchaeum aerophilus]|uniref:Uncharacterized protein n=1 Tax=Natranaeroarchaeum aerophilus TaxID=2917711 RepID=A0AAE3FUG2_9EURY|nr:hypothetical protein [Natranaeroarchaeum aerophilus]MCL9815165.1 hypothetical protein [Natranaeroarchaeum aerophilus]
MNQQTTAKPEPTVRTAVLVAALVVMTLVTIPMLATSAIADEHDDPETADDYFETFRAMEGTEAYEEYDELETVRTFATSQTQEIGSLDTEQEAELAALLETMIAFEQAYDHAEDGNYEASLEAAEETDDAIEELESHDQTQATLADLALTRFYEQLGNGLREDAEAADRTPDRIDLLTMTATAYERANLPDEAAEFNLQVEQQTAEYEGALERMDRAENDSETFFDHCGECMSMGTALTANANVLGLFEQYQTAQTVNADLDDAEAAAAAHGLDDREGEIAAINQDVSSAQIALALSSVGVLVGYGVVIGLVGALLFGRVFAWQRTYDRSQVGSVVTVGDTDV